MTQLWRWFTSWRVRLSLAGLAGAITTVRVMIGVELPWAVAATFGIGKAVSVLVGLILLTWVVDALRWLYRQMIVEEAEQED